MNLEKVHNLLIDCELDYQGIDTHHTLEELVAAREYIGGLVQRMQTEKYYTNTPAPIEEITLKEILEG